MTATSTAEFEPAPPVRPPADVRLFVWPLWDEGLWAWGMALGALGVAILAGMLSESVTMGLASFAALAAALWRLWLPVRFEMNPRGVTEEVLGWRRRIPWSAIARYDVRRHGVVLLPTRDPAPMAVLRGVYIRFGSQRAEVTACLAYYLRSRQGE